MQTLRTLNSSPGPKSYRDFRETGPRPLSGSEAEVGFSSFVKHAVLTLTRFLFSMVYIQKASTPVSLLLKGQVLST